MNNLASLLHEQELLKSRIGKITYGSVEIRERDVKKYIYVHFREDGINQTKYVGEYTRELYNVILENNQLVKQYKKLFRIDGIELEFEDEALDEIAQLAEKRKTGARGLRSITENLMTKLMYDSPSDEKLKKIVVTGKMVKGETKEPEKEYKDA